MTNVERALSAARPESARILGRCLEGAVPSDAEALDLLSAEGPDLEALAAAADEVRRAGVGDVVAFVVVRNINFTNVCEAQCRFCNFSRPPGHPEAFRLGLDEVVRRAAEAEARGATEICLQGGIDPETPPTRYREILAAVRARCPGIHLHAFSPFEVFSGARRSGVSVERFLRDLREAGLGSMPGTAAEIFDAEIRRAIAPRKLTTPEWVETVETAHRMGIRTTATIMYGHLDAPAHRVAHMALLREIQRRTGGFTEIVPLPFVHPEAPLHRDGTVSGGPSPADDLRLHAVARLMLRGAIDHVQVSWVKMGHPLAQRILRAGADDYGGTLMDEAISRSAGATHGEETTPAEFVRGIRAIGRTPARRSTLYEILEVYDDHDPPGK